MLFVHGSSLHEIQERKEWSVEGDFNLTGSTVEIYPPWNKMTCQKKGGMLFLFLSFFSLLTLCDWVSLSNFSFNQ